MSATSPITPDTHVTIRYALFEDVSPGASAADPAEEPITVSYIHGYGQVLPAIEQALEGKAQGNHLSVTAEPEDAFGPHDEDGVFEIEKDGLDGAADLRAGEEVVATGPEGEVFMRIVEVRDETLLVDTNHPLAGKRVRFEVEILEVRPATDDEIEEAQAELDAHDDACGCGQDHSLVQLKKSPN